MRLVLSSLHSQHNLSPVGLQKGDEKNEQFKTHIVCAAMLHTSTDTLRLRPGILHLLGASC